MYLFMYSFILSFIPGLSSVLLFPSLLAESSGVIDFWGADCWLASELILMHHVQHLCLIAGL